MRPDQHKKKKNAVYKKKHGIAHRSSNESTNKEKGVKNDVTHVDKQEEWRSLKTTKSKDQNRDKVQDLSSSDDSSSDSDEPRHVISRSKKQFRKREIVSNWQKYELQPDANDKALDRGERYETLLNMAGEAMSRFRFRDELEWEDDQDLGDPGTSTEEHHGCLQLDPMALTQSLSCIPVHRLLDIEEDLFVPEQLESLLQTASNNAKLYSAKDISVYKEDPTNSQTRSEYSTHKCDNSNTKEWNKPTVEQQTDKVKTTIVDTLPSNHPAPLTQSKESSCCKHNFEGNTQCITEEASQPSVAATNHTLSLQDNDLDRLLDLDLDQQETVSNHNGSQLSSTAAKLNGKDSSQIPCAVNDYVKEDKKDEKGSEDLEEWLDSILD